MLNQTKVMDALQAKQSQFEAFQREQRVERDRVQTALARVRTLSARDVEQRLAELEAEHTGARPTNEWDEAEQLCLPFTHAWANHREAREWALATLRERPVLAVDGSQIVPTKDFSPPIGAVQIGWFLNHRDGSYEKDIAFHVLAPLDLAEDIVDVEQNPPARRVHQRRFELEAERLCLLMERYRDDAAGRKPVCFFDGSFIISFAAGNRSENTEPYVQAVRKLLRCSQDFRVPLVGFVDNSASRDLSRLIGLLADPGGQLAIGDAALLDSQRAHGVFQQWGDRSPLFICDRDDELRSKGYADFYRDVVFAYVKLAGERPPARVEMPRWLYDDGLAEEVLDVVRAECVIGVGYPYAIETADAVAVISQQDRQRFYREVQRFAEENNIPFSMARKANSKRIRR